MSPIVLVFNANMKLIKDTAIMATRPLGTLFVNHGRKYIIPALTATRTIMKIRGFPVSHAPGCCFELIELGHENNYCKTV